MISSAQDDRLSQLLLVGLGLLLILASILGFFIPDLFDLHLTWGHNLIHLVLGVLALCFALRGGWSVRAFAIIFGVVYGLLGLVGLTASGGADDTWILIPHHLVLGIADHIAHLVLGAALLFTGFVGSTSSWADEVEAEATKEGPSASIKSGR